MKFDCKCGFTPPTILLGLFFCPWTSGIFFLVGSNILLLMAVQQCYSFAVLKGEDELTSFHFAILCPYALGWDKIFQVYNHNFGSPEN